MLILETLLSKSTPLGLAFLVIGGHALNAYGRGRQTGDLDLLIPREDAEAWKLLLSQLDFTLKHEHRVFIQFKPKEIAAWPIDIMLVDNETFDKISTQSIEVNLGNAKCRIPSVGHLIALKLHALKGGGDHRLGKDFEDIMFLVQEERIDVSTKEFEKLCLRYGNQGILNKIREAQRKRQLP